MNKHALAMIERLRAAGISHADALALRRISMTLRRWHELERGDGNGRIERHATTDKPFWRSARSGNRWPIPDRELGAHKRLYNIMRRYPTLKAFVQTVPRGAALYVLRPGDVPEGGDVFAYYSRGIAVCK